MKQKFRIGSIASGMGMHLHGLKQIGGIPVWAIECDEAIAQCYRNNHEGRLYVKKVEDVDPQELEEVDLLIATLSCKNASVSKGAKRGETEEDLKAGVATANIIKAKLPKYFMLENVWAYRSFEAFKQIQTTLSECGYCFRFYKFNCRHWGVAQSRDRLYGLAVREGSFLDPVPPQIQEVGWYEAIADLIDELPEATLAPWQQKKFPELVNAINSCLIPGHSNWTNIVPETKPALTVRAGHQTFKALIKRCGGGRDNDRLYQEDEPSFTIRAMGRKASNHSRIADAVVGDKIVAVTPRACLRFFGDKETADSIWLPSVKSLANEVVGNGASWVMFRELFNCIEGRREEIKEKFKVGDRVKIIASNTYATIYEIGSTQVGCKSDSIDDVWHVWKYPEEIQVIEQMTDLISRIHKFLSECDRPAQSAGDIAQAIGADINEVGNALREGRDKGLFKNSMFGYWILNRTDVFENIIPVSSQEIFNQFRNELGGFTSAIELSESEIELIEGVGACYYHIRKDEQITIRKLAVLRQHQKQGWGRLLVYRVICRAIEEGKSSIFLKCPDGLPANNFYQKLGFELEATEPGKKRLINHWRYHIKLPLLFYCGGGGKSEYDAIADDVGWNLGINSSGKNKSHQHMMMVDNDYKNYKHEMHLEMVQKNKPLIATALDVTSPEQLPEIIKQAEELAQYAGRVLLIPKCDVEIPKKYWLGYSVESGYGSTPLSPEWFSDRPVHLLGGSPKKQALAYPQMNVVSLDANYAMNLARKCKAVWSDGNKNIEQREQGCYQALDLSLKKQFEFWRNLSADEVKHPVPKESDKWYTPHQIVDLVTQVLGAIDLDPCADEGKHIPASCHYTADDDGLSHQWQGKVYMNPPYSCPGKWMEKMQAEFEAGRVTEAIALVPAATDTNWLFPYLEKQPICFWKGRIKFLDTNYEPKQSARQSHCLVYWGANPQKFKQVFDTVGSVKNVEEDTMIAINRDNAKVGTYVILKTEESLGIITENLGFGFVVDWLKAEELFLAGVNSFNWERDSQLIESIAIAPQDIVDKFLSENRVPEINSRIDDTKFCFPQTEAIASQIAQLQEQLNQLTSSLQPYKECEEMANNLLNQVAEHAKLMRDKGIEERSLVDWADKLYFAASGAEIAQTDDDTELLKQEIEGLKFFNKLLREERERLERQINVYKQDTQEIDSYLQDIKRLEGENTKYQGNAFNYHADKLKLISQAATPTNPEANIQISAQQFIDNIKTKKDVGVIAWEDIKELCQGEAAVLREVAIAARTKTQKDFVTKLPELLADYVKRTGDKSDFDWVGDTFKTKAEELLQAKFQEQTNAILEAMPEAPELALSTA